MIITESIANCSPRVQVMEFTMTEGRHEIHSELTSEVISQSIFPNTVDEVMDLKGHIQVVDQILEKINISYTYCIVYVTGLTILLQALYISWMKRISAIDSPSFRGKLIFAHRDRQSQSYKLFCSQTGECIEVESLSNLMENTFLDSIIV